MNTPGVQNGIFAGLVSIVYSMILWFVNADLMFNFLASSVVGLVILIFFMVRAGNETKLENDGFLTFKQALKPTFLTFVVASFLSMVFMYILYTFIDPTLNDLALEKGMEMSEKVARFLGANDEAIEQIRIEGERQMEAGTQRGLGQYIFGFAGSLIFGFIISLIVSAIIKKNPPEGAAV